MIRRLELSLWALAVLLAFTGWRRLRSAEHGRLAAPVPELTAVPAAVRGAPAPMLERQANAVAAGNPFRLDRAAAPVPFARPARGPSLPPAPPRPPPPPLAVSGIVGPPWAALLDGVPGREGSLLVRSGDRVGDLRIRSVSRTLVVVQGPDTTWRLTMKRTWQ